jgi:hypothetical protein
MGNTDRWTTGMPSSRCKPAFDGLLAAAWLSCCQISRPILSRRATAERTAGELARGAMAGFYRQRYLLPLFAAVQNCTLDASFALRDGCLAEPMPEVAFPRAVSFWHDVP